MAKARKVLIRLPRQYARGDLIEVKTMIIHPNSNGRRKHKSGGFIAEHYVKKIEVVYGGLPLIDLNTSSAISENPFFTFLVKADRAAPLTVTWRDSEGGTFTKTVDVEV